MTNRPGLLRLLSLTAMVALFAAAAATLNAAPGCRAADSGGVVVADALPDVHPLAARGDVAELGAARAGLSAVSASPRLYQINLPAGNTGSINVGWFKNGATILDPKVWLDDGDDSDPEPDDFDGVRFVGQGVGVTHLRCTSYDGVTVAVGRHAGLVQVENATVHCGYDRALVFGQQNLARELVPEFQARLIDCEVVADPLGSYGASSASVSIAGGGYAVGQEARVVGGAGASPALRVTAVNAAGGVTRLEVVSGLNGSYSSLPPPQAATTGGSGSGLTVSLVYRRPKWLFFSYQADVVLLRVRFRGKNAVEHDAYLHGVAKHGAYVRWCIFESAAAECFKVRSDTTETAWPGPNARFYILDSTFADWHQPHSWRGGAGIVAQGSAGHWRIERCSFTGSGALGDVTANDRSKAIMFSSEGLSYDQETGAENVGFGNGHVLIRNIVAEGFSEVEWGNSIIRCARNGGAQMSARSFTLEDSGVWGDRKIVQAGELPAGGLQIRGCNTTALRDYSRSVGMRATVESTFPTSSRRVPLSEGISR